jgi:outer membrane protein insertion porin family
VLFDPNLVISISGLAIGDKVMIPGTDVFGKAINKLWRQNLISQVEINFIKLTGRDLTIEIAITERPRLANFKLIGPKKGERDDLEGKIPLAKERVVTENMKLSAVEAIRKFYYDKGFRNVTIEMKEEDMPELNNAISLTFYINKGAKVKVNSVNFSGNEYVESSKLKKQMKGTKEMFRASLKPDKVVSPYGDTAKTISLKSYLNDYGYLSPSKRSLLLNLISG